MVTKLKLISFVVAPLRNLEDDYVPDYCDEIYKYLLTLDVILRSFALMVLTRIEQVASTLRLYVKAK